MKRNMLLIVLVFLLVIFFSRLGFAQVNEYYLVPVDLEVGTGDSTVQININISVIEDIVSFVVLTLDYNPTEQLREELKQQVIKIMGKTLKPRDIKFVSDLPKTRSAKIVRRIIKAQFLGQDIGDLSSIENPDAVEYIKNAI